MRFFSDKTGEQLLKSAIPDRNGLLLMYTNLSS